VDKDQKQKSRPQGKQEEIPTAGFSGPRFEPGFQLGKFHIERQLGHGGAGIVYLARDTKLDRPVAIKSIAPEIMNYPQVLRRWKREARLLASLNHPNIAAIYEEIGESEEASYLVLEYVPGDTLTERIARGSLDQDEAIGIALQIADALSASHEQGVVHRDLKPGNIKITPKGRVKVLDFGIGKVVAEDRKDAFATVVTQPGQVIGTPGYMSPEQTLGKETDTRSDIWSFGCVLYEMLTAKRPFPGGDTSEILESMLKVDPNWDAVPDTVLVPLRNVIRKCLEKDSEKRYQSAKELHQDLSDYHDTLVSRPPTAFDFKQLLRSLHRPIVFVPTVLVVAAICVVLFWLTDRTAKIRWARTVAIPEIGRLIEQQQYLTAFKLVRRAEIHIPTDPLLLELWPELSHSLLLTTEPPGAEILYREYSNIDGDWEYLGRSPLDLARFPAGRYRLRADKEGYEATEIAYL